DPLGAPAVILGAAFCRTREVIATRSPMPPISSTMISVICAASSPLNSSMTPVAKRIFDRIDTAAPIMTFERHQGNLSGYAEYIKSSFLSGDADPLLVGLRKFHMIIIRRVSTAVVTAGKGRTVGMDIGDTLQLIFHMAVLDEQNERL